MRKRILSFTIILTIFMTACAAPKANPQPTTTPTDLSPTPAPSPNPEPTEVQPERDAAITAIANQAQARTTANDEYGAAQEGMDILIGGSVQTFEEARVSLNLRPEGTIIRVGPNSIFTVQALTEDGQSSTRIQLDLGQIWILLNGGSMEVETPSGVAAVRGSLLGVLYDPVLNFMEVSCLEGHCTLENEFGVVELTDGQISFILGELGPSEIEFMDASKLQEWVNENPDVWLFFDPENIPEWLPTPDLDWLNEKGGYFEWVFDEGANPFLDEFLDNYDPEIPPLDGAGLLDNPPDLPDSPPDLPDDPPDPPGGFP